MIKRLDTFRAKYNKKEGIIKVKNELLKDVREIEYNGTESNMIYFLEKYLKSQGYEVISYTDMYDRGMFIHANFNRELEEYKEFKRLWRESLGI